VWWPPLRASIIRLYDQEPITITAQTKLKNISRSIEA
jgi:hypothetical protein